VQFEIQARLKDAGGRPWSVGMATFKAVYVNAFRFGPLAGWAVERTSLGDPTVIVSPIYPGIGDADVETARLRKIEAWFYA
jgi:hypothetical protein